MVEGERVGSHLGFAGNGETVVVGAREVDGVVAPVGLRRRRGDDGVREDEARTMGRTARSGTARVDVEVPTEELRATVSFGK